MWRASDVLLWLLLGTQSSKHLTWYCYIFLGVAVEIHGVEKQEGVSFRAHFHLLTDKEQALNSKSQ